MRTEYLITDPNKIEEPWGVSVVVMQPPIYDGGIHGIFMLNFWFHDDLPF